MGLTPQEQEAFKTATEEQGMVLTPDEQRTLLDYSRSILELNFGENKEITLELLASINLVAVLEHYRKNTPKEEE